MATLLFSTGTGHTVKNHWRLCNNEGFIAVEQSKSRLTARCEALLVLDIPFTTSSADICLLSSPVACIHDLESSSDTWYPYRCCFDYTMTDCVKDAVCGMLACPASSEKISNCGDPVVFESLERLFLWKR